MYQNIIKKKKLKNMDEENHNFDVKPRCKQLDILTPPSA